MTISNNQNSNSINNNCIPNNDEDFMSLITTQYEPKIKSILKRLGIFEDENKDLYDELYQAGLLGVIEALNSYSLNSKTPLRVYLQNNIVYSMVKSFRLNFIFSGYIDRLSLEDFQKLINEELDESLCPHSCITSVPFTPRSNYLDDSPTNNVEDIVLGNVIYNSILILIPLLSPTEQYIIIHIYGLFGNKTQTYREIAAYLNIEYYNVNHIHNRILKKLKQLYETTPESPLKR